MRYIASMAILVAACFDLLSMWLRSFDVDFEEGEYPPDRWISWGTVRMYSDCQSLRYFFVKLPSWDWQQYQGRDWRWHQRVLSKYGDRWSIWFCPAR